MSISELGDEEGPEGLRYQVRLPAYGMGNDMDGFTRPPIGLDLDQNKMLRSDASLEVRRLSYGITHTTLRSRLPCTSTSFTLMR